MYGPSRYMKELIVLCCRNTHQYFALLTRHERSSDLERLCDLINIEVRNLKQRKSLGKLSIDMSRPAWEDMS